MLQFALDESIQLLQQTVQQFSLQEVAPIANEIDIYGQGCLQNSYRKSDC